MKYTVVYSINNVPFYLRMFELSIKSLRIHSPNIRIVVFYFGTPNAKIRKLVATFGFDLVAKPTTAPDQMLATRWASIAEIESDSVLVVDADTYFYGPAETLFEIYRNYDFAARHEYGLGQESAAKSSDVSGDFNWNRYTSLCDTHKIEPGAIYNMGVRIFNRGAHLKFRTVLPLFFKIIDQLGTLSKENRGVLNNPHLYEEVAATMALSSLRELKKGPIKMQDSPWFFEWIRYPKLSKGIVMHYLNNYCYQWAATEFADKKIAPELLRLAEKHHGLNLPRLK